MTSNRTVSHLFLVLMVVGGLASCSTSTATTGSTVRTTFPRTTVFAVIVPTTTTPSTTTAVPAVDANGDPVTAAPPAAGPAIAAVAAPGASTTYVVQANDLLVRIAKRFNCRYADIMTANNYIGDPNKFLPPVGQTIALPATCQQNASTATTTVKGPKTTNTVKGTSTTATTKGGNTTTTTATSGSAAATYTVVANDTLIGIAKKNVTTVQAIATANGWTDGSSPRINPGDIIKLPAKKT